jgi:peroxiredoxin
MKSIPSIIVPIIREGESLNCNLFDLLKNKKVVIFGVPGAFTPTCSEKHLPGFIKLSYAIKTKGIDDLFCLSVNDPFVMKSWLLSYTDNHNIAGIADGNGEVTKLLDLVSDKSSNFMGLRCTRFAMIVDNNFVSALFIEEPGKLDVSSAEYILSKL